MLRKQILFTYLSFFLIPTLGLAQEEASVTKIETAKAETASVIKVSNAWVAEAPPNATVLAGYMQLENTSDQEIILNNVQSEDFKEVAIHETVLKADKVSMVAHETLSIPAGEIVSLQPGGFHLMLIGAKRPLKAGDTTEITLEFQTEVTQSVKMEVKKRSIKEQDHHHHQH